MAAEFNIIHDKGSTFKLYSIFKTNTDTVIDLANYTARMQVRRSPDSSNLVLFITGSTMNNAGGTVHNGSVTHGGTTGVFTIGGGTTGTGDIKLNAGTTGATGTTGGIFIEFDSVTSSSIPTGRHFYDIELVEGEEGTRLIGGRFEARANITR